MTDGENPELGISITGNADEALAAAKAVQDSLNAVKQATLDAQFASDALTRAQEDAAQAFYDVVKAQQAEADTLSSVDVALTQTSQLQATAYNSVAVALEQKRVAMLAVADAEQAFNAQMENGLAILRAQSEVAGQSAASIATLGTTGQSAFGKLVMGSREAHGAMLGLNTAMQGGVSSVVGLSRVLNDLFLLVRTAGAAAGPWALLALAIGAVLGVLRGLTQHFGEHKTAVDHATKSHKDFQDEAKRDLKTIDQEVKDLTASYSALETRIHAATEATKEMAAAQLKLSEDTIKSDEKVRLSKAQSAAQEKAIHQDSLDQLSKLKTATEENDIINQKLAANLQKQTADRQSTAIEAQRRNVESLVSGRQQAFDTARGGISDEDAREAINSGAEDQLRPLIAGQKKALDARAARDAAQGQLDEFNKDAEPKQDKLDAQSRAADDALARSNVAGADLGQRERGDAAQGDIEVNKKVRDIVDKEAALKAGQASVVETYNESIKEAQNRLFSSQGAAFNANQTMLNRIVDGFQAELAAYEKTLRDLEAQRRKFDATRSNIGP